MKTVVRCLLVLAVMIVLAAPVYSAPQAKPAPQAKSAPSAQSAAPAASADADSYDNVEVLHVFACEMSPGVTEEQVDAIAQLKFKALRQMPGAEKAQVHVLWPVAVSKMGKTDFQIVWTFPSFSEWGKFWDNYTDASPLARSDDVTEGKVECPDSMMWEAHRIALPK